MKTLKLFAAPLAIGAAVALTAAAPVHAQHNQRDAWRLTPARNSEIRQDIGSLRNAIDRAASRRTISQREANNLRADARDVQRVYASYARNGLSRREVQALQTRVNTVRAALRMERRDWDGQRG